MDVALDEAARRAPFTVPAPPRIPRGAEVWVSLVEASERPPTAAQVGTHVAAMSDSMPVAALIDLMLSLERAPTEPPELV